MGKNPVLVGGFYLMWFSPKDITLTANSANSANFKEEKKEISEISEISNVSAFENAKDEPHKLAELAKLATYQNLMVTCYTPSGEALQIMAKDKEHAEWLLKVNPKPTGEVTYES